MLPHAFSLFDEASLACSGDTSQAAADDASRPSSGDGSRLCLWCRSWIRATRSDSVYCSKKCRQTAWRFRQRVLTDESDASPKALGYADPPYPRMAKLLYGKEPTYAGEVDHPALIASLVDRYDGWALSTGAYALREILPLCPADVRVCAWVKPIGVSSKTCGLHNTWEPLIVKPARSLRPGKRDWLRAMPARGGGTLIGRKPIAFAAFLFDALGAAVGDRFDDIFPGTGVMSRAWRQFNLVPATARTPAASPGSASDTRDVPAIDQRHIDVSGPSTAGRQHDR